VALRTLWAAWDEADPNAIEEALAEVSSDAEEPPAVRVYAALLEAYARRRRGDLGGARSRIAQLGFVDKWLFVGPFDNDGKTGLATSYGPEASGLISSSQEYEGKDHRRTLWRPLPALSPYGWVDFGSFLRPAENVCVYATTFVRDPHVTGQNSRTASIWIGATGAFQLSWNGTQVLADDRYRDLDSDRFAEAVVVRSGWNRLTVKLCGDDRPPMLSLRLATADGAVDNAFQIDADLAHAVPEGGNAAIGQTARPARLQGPEGPMQAFERLSKNGDASVLEDFARYLETSGADDPTEHRGRELARMAADKAPTVGRLLLAASMAENRNQRAAWIDRAETVVRLRAGSVKRDEELQVLLARADYLRGGIDPRSALPYYEHALAVDPESVSALLGKVSLYQEAGLRDTALAILQRALALAPRCVALLRATTAALRDDGRETEADEMAERYAAVRFDDPSFVRAHVDLAVARFDHRAAEHWMNRLLELAPDNSGALQTVADAWLRLGDRARAIAAFRTALEDSPEDTDVMRQLATVYGVAGDRDERFRLLKRVLELAPQAKDVRDEIVHVGPPAPRADVTYVRSAEEFLPLREKPLDGQGRRSLVDLQVTTVLTNGLATRLHQLVFQPLTESAAEAAREYDFTYEADTDVVQLFAARVYRKDGRVDEAIDSGPGAMADDPALAIYTSERNYYVRFPRLEPGDVVEIQYRVEDVAARNAFSDYFGEVVYMQSPEPIARSEYVLITPRSRDFYFNDPRVPGIERTVEYRGDQRIFQFVAHDVPAVKEESLQPAWTEVLGHVNVSTYRTWGEMGRWYWGLVKDQFVADDELRRRAASLTHGLPDVRAKVRAIYDYVVQGTRYVALEFGIHGYKPYRSAQIFARGFGDCKDKATLLVTMLEAVGIEATPVIVRTRNKGDIEAAPASLAPFDHMIAYVPALDLYLDGTAEYSGSTELPAMDRGALALQVNRGDAKLVHLPDAVAETSVSLHTVEATVSRDGSAQIDWRADVTGVEAPQWRARFHAKATRHERIGELISTLLPGTSVVSFDAGNLDDVEVPVALHATGKSPAFARTQGDLLAIPVEPTEHMIRDYAPESDRALDVRLYARWMERDDWTIHVPNGSKIVSLPSSKMGTSPFGTYAIEVGESETTVHVTTTVSLRTTRVPASDYPAFRAWCEEVDRALGQRAMVTVK
jgi:tetratricopeptide (TPR) repeat protein